MNFVEIDEKIILMCANQFGIECMQKKVRHNSRNITLLKFVRTIGCFNILSWVERSHMHDKDWKLKKGVEAEMQYIADRYAEYKIEQIIQRARRKKYKKIPSANNQEIFVS